MNVEKKQTEQREYSVCFKGFWPDFYRRKDYERFLPLKILREKYNITLVEKKADFVFCSLFNPCEYLKEEGIRILYTGEPYCPNWNVVDYAIGFDKMTYGDRYLSFPNMYCFDRLEAIADLEHDNVNDKLFDRKFCNFLYNDFNDRSRRKEFVQLLNKYKHIESAGRVLRNVNDRVSIHAKEQYLHQYKFTIAFESCTNENFYTEKIIDPYIANSIPIYFGDPLISEVFNLDSMVCANGREFADVVKEVEFLDQNFEAYMQKLRHKKLKNCSYPKDMYDNLCIFMNGIIQNGTRKRRNDSRYGLIETRNLKATYAFFNNCFFQKCKSVIERIKGAQYNHCHRLK